MNKDFFYLEEKRKENELIYNIENKNVLFEKNQKNLRLVSKL
jgi:hypothetical protein